MQFTALLTFIATFSMASAAALPEQPSLEVRSCPKGDFHSGSRGSTNGCAWYYCDGVSYKLWIDCGNNNACKMVSGHPGCSY